MQRDARENTEKLKTGVRSATQVASLTPEYSQNPQKTFRYRPFK